jgi:Spy/CpxP family protein refolding chaperone
MSKWTLLAVFLPCALSAQMPPLGGVCRQGGRPARDLNLTEAQQKQITAICKDYAKKVFDLRENWNKAEGELQTAFDESPVDQAKSNVAIEHLAAARSELFKTTSQMDLKIRTVLTDDQWRELKARDQMRDRRGPGGPPGIPGAGPDWRRGPRPNKATTVTTSQPQPK